MWRPTLVDWCLIASVLIAVVVFLYANEMTGAETCSCDCPCTVEKPIVCEDECPASEWEEYRETKSTLESVLPAVPLDIESDEYEPILDRCRYLVWQRVRCECNKKLSKALALLTAKCYSSLSYHGQVAARILEPYKDSSAQIRAWWIEKMLEDLELSYRICVVKKKAYCVEDKDAVLEFIDQAKRLSAYRRFMSEKQRKRFDSISKARW